MKPNAYLKYKMVAISTSRQNRGFDTHMDRKEWWRFHIILLEVFLLFRKLFVFQEFSWHFEERKLIASTSKTERASFICMEVILKNNFAGLPNVSHLVALDITVLANNCFPFDNVTPICRQEYMAKN
jgi:hypothetical protein